MPTAYLQWWFSSGERVVARGPLVVNVFLFVCCVLFCFVVVLFCFVEVNTIVVCSGGCGKVVATIEE